MKIWERGQGCGSSFESEESHDRFVQFLDMGEARSITRLAARLGVSHQSLSKTAKRFSWRERAAYWDRRDDPQPRKPPKIKPAVPEAPAPPPPPGVTDEPIEPEVLGRIAEQHATTSLTHKQSLSRYRQVYESIGYGMAVEACHVFPIAKAMRVSIGRAVEASENLHDAGDHEGAMRILSGMEASVRTYLNLTNVLHSYANGGRMHWGDAIGVHRIIEEVWGKQGVKR